MKKVYFTKEISKDSILKIYKVLEKELKGKVAVKVHSGEVGNQNFLGPELFKDVIDYVSGVVVECNTAYDGKRRNTSDHLETMKLHGWSKYFKVDILDEKEDIILKINDGKHIEKNYVGANLVNYDSMLVLSHFKGHPMGGFGGALKNISIGLASSYGKHIFTEQVILLKFGLLNVIVLSNQWRMLQNQLLIILKIILSLSM